MPSHYVRASLTAIVKPRINNQIAAQELRVIDAEGKNLGVLSREQALALVVPGSGLDLIEIAASAKPPVARVMSFDKYRYEQEKKEKKERQAQKGGGAKRVQISYREAEHDLQMKLKRLEEFLGEGHQVEILLRMRGREKGKRDIAMQKLRDFLGLITTEYKVMMPAKPAGNGIFTQIAKK